VSHSFFVRAAPIATSMMVDGPEAIDRHPKVLERSGRRPGETLLMREEWRRSRQGKKVSKAVAGTRSRAR